MTVALAALAGTVVLGLVSTLSTAIKLLASTALIMTGTFTPTPDQKFIDMAINQYIQPTQPDTYDPVVAVTTPEQAWPVTGLFDDTFGKSVRIGLRDLKKEISQAPADQPILVFGYSQSGVISMKLKRQLSRNLTPGVPPPPIQFMVIGDLNRPNGGVMARFPGVYLPFINFKFNGPELTDTPFATTSIARDYDGFADWPLYPLNAVASLNAIMGIFIVHTDYESVSLDPGDPRYVDGTRVHRFGDTTYYSIPTNDLPLLYPLRAIGLPESIVDIVEPVVRWAVELGYDRTINPGVPTPARLIPNINLSNALDDLAAALEQSWRNAANVWSPAPPLLRPISADPAKASSAAADALGDPGELKPAEDRDAELTLYNDASQKPSGPAPTEPSPNVDIGGLAQARLTAETGMPETAPMPDTTPPESEAVDRFVDDVDHTQVSPVVKLDERDSTPTTNAAQAHTEDASAPEPDEHTDRTEREARRPGTHRLSDSSAPRSVDRLHRRDFRSAAENATKNEELRSEGAVSSKPVTDTASTDSTE